MLITHNLGVVAEMADHVVVMYLGPSLKKARLTIFFTRPTSIHPGAAALDTQHRVYPRVKLPPSAAPFLTRTIAHQDAHSIPAVLRLCQGSATRKNPSWRP
jgi:ABC-type dipeptide/oligopeptide/nickel transport system ATPase component